MSGAELGRQVRRGCAVGSCPDSEDLLPLSSGGDRPTTPKAGLCAGRGVQRERLRGSWGAVLALGLRPGLAALRMLQTPGRILSRVRKCPVWRCCVPPAGGPLGTDLDEGTARSWVPLSNGFQNVFSGVHTEIERLL